MQNMLVNAFSPAVVATISDVLTYRRMARLSWPVITLQLRITYSDYLHCTRTGSMFTSPSRFWYIHSHVYSYDWKKFKSCSWFIPINNKQRKLETNTAITKNTNQIRGTNWDTNHISCFPLSTPSTNFRIWLTVILQQFIKLLVRHHFLATSQTSLRKVLSFQTEKYASLPLEKRIQNILDTMCQHAKKSVQWNNLLHKANKIKFIFKKIFQKTAKNFSFWTNTEWPHDRNEPRHSLSCYTTLAQATQWQYQLTVRPLTGALCSRVLLRTGFNDSLILSPDFGSLDLDESRSCSSSSDWSMMGWGDAGIEWSFTPTAETEAADSSAAAAAVASLLMSWQLLSSSASASLSSPSSSHSATVLHRKFLQSTLTVNLYYSLYLLWFKFKLNTVTRKYVDIVLTSYAAACQKLLDPTLTITLTFDLMNQNQRISYWCPKKSSHQFWFFYTDSARVKK